MLPTDRLQWYITLHYEIATQCNSIWRWIKEQGIIFFYFHVGTAGLFEVSLTSQYNKLFSTWETSWESPVGPSITTGQHSRSITEVTLGIIALGSDNYPKHMASTPAKTLVRNVQQIKHIIHTCLHRCCRRPRDILRLSLVEHAGVGKYWVRHACCKNVEKK